MHGRIITGLLVALFLAGGAGNLSAGGGREQGAGPAEAPTRSDADNLPSVFVSVLPQQYFVSRIAGETVEIGVVVPPGQGPTTYDPTPRQITALASADVYFTIGVPFEDSFVPRLSQNVSSLRIVDTAREVERRYLDAHGHDEEDGRESDEHDDELGAPDPHVWMGPEAVKRQLGVIVATLVELFPAEANRYRANYAAFVRDIDDLTAEIKDILAPYEGETFYIYHPALGYFADAFGLEQEAVETGGDQPTPAQLGRIIESARNEGVKVIFVQPEFSDTAAQRVAEAIGGSVVRVNPLDPDWLTNMRHIAQAIADGLQ